jgi:Ca2+/H+ antiporter
MFQLVQQLYLFIHQSVLFRLDRRDHPKAFYSVMVTTSRWISMTLLSVFVLKLWFQLRTHSTLFDLADRKDAVTDDDDDDDDDEYVRRPRSNLLALGMAFLLVFLAITICAYNLATALSRLDVSEPDYSIAPSELHRSISLIFFTVLPIVLEIPRGLKFVGLAIDNRMDLVRTFESRSARISQEVD